MSDEASSSNPIGGKYCQDELSPGLIPATSQTLTPYERDALWRIFQEIGRFWEDLYEKATDSSNLKSSWLDFIVAKTESEPSYIGEYSNAVLCVDELIEVHGKKEAFEKLFTLNKGVSDPPPLVTRLHHAKKYVIDEFIRVNVVASGFKSFGAKEGERARNYKGYLGGSRYNLKSRVRAYDPKSKTAKTTIPAK